MLVYKDKITGDEIITDTFKMKLISDLYYEVEGKLTTEKTTEISDSLIGGNASAEGLDEATDGSNGQSGIDIIMSARLQRTTFSLRTYKTYIKGYMGTILALLEKEDKERAAFFKTEIATFMKTLFKNFGDWEFFTGESMNPDGMVVLLNYREDGETPYVVLFKDGLIEEKC